MAVLYLSLNYLKDLVVSSILKLSLVSVVIASSDFVLLFVVVGGGVFHWSLFLG